jgi:hypothetical protein
MLSADKRTPLSQSDIDRIADAITPRLISQVHAQHHEFWIDPKIHYDEHHGLREMLTDYRLARGLFWKIFIWALAAGAAVIATIGNFKGWFKGGL